MLPPPPSPRVVTPATTRPALGCLGRRATEQGRRRGYTAVEVLVGVSLLGLGAAGVMTMQRTSIQANVHARRLDMASNIARTWIERVRADSTLWTLPSPSRPNELNIARTQFLANGTSATFIDTGRRDEDEGWFLPDQVLAGPSGGTSLSPAFDALGNDVAPDSAARVFCTHIRIDCLSRTPMPDGTPVRTCSLMRANVRVFWPRGTSTAPAADFCSRTNIQAVQNAVGSPYHFVYATTAIRQNMAQ